MANLMTKHCRRTTTELETAAWAAKILFLLVGIVSTAVLTSRFAFPYLLRLVSFSLPKLRNHVLSWLAPPYLFITVHFIIMVIWKLHRNQRPDDAVVGRDNSSAGDSSHLSSTEPVTNDVPMETISDERDISIEKPPLESEPNTTVVDERRTEQWPQQLHPPPETETEEPKEDMDYSVSTDPDSIDGTWKAIMDGKSSPVNKRDTCREKASHAQPKQPTSPATLTRAAAVDVRKFKKSGTFREATTTSVDEGIAVPKKEMRKSKTFRESMTAAAPAAATGWRGRDVLVVGQDELFRKVEAFIKMNYDQMRLQRQESEQRRRFVEMANAAC